jgi:hypothetical protein
MSSKVSRRVSVTPSKGKGPAIAGPSDGHPTQNNSSGEDSEELPPFKVISLGPDPTNDLFVLAQRVEEVLAGQSKKTIQKVLNMVGSLHGTRTIPVDRPIGQTTVGRVTNVTAGKKEKGKPTPPAPWKQTDDYRRLDAERKESVALLKSLSGPVAKAPVLDKIRNLEQSLKELKGSHSGNQ